LDEERELTAIPASLAFMFDAGESPWSALPAIGSTPTSPPLDFTVIAFSDFVVENGHLQQPA
jgi:hypothetical protein